MRTGVPTFAELPVRDGAPPESSWGVFGDDDDLGTVNFLTSEHVRAAAGLVRRGATFSLNWDVSLPAPGFFMRHPPAHTMIEKFDGMVLDDWVDGFYLQGSTQWDGLRHFQDPDHGFYNGATLAEVSRPGPGKLGVEHLAERTIVARGVLLDVVRVLARSGVELDPFDYFPIDDEVLVRTAAEEGVELRGGDILVVRTGWVEAYTALDGDARARYADEGRPGSPGLAAAQSLPAFLWDTRITAVAADNPALEAAQPRLGADLSLHKALIARLGMPLGELWQLGELAADCERDGIYEFLLTSAPMNLAGGCGTPANAVAVK